MSARRSDWSLEKGWGQPGSSAHHFGCSTARNKGPTACTNLRIIRCEELEDTVLSALRERLMEPELFKIFAEEFTAEWNRLQGQASAEQAARADEMHRVRQQINRLVDAITEGTPAAVRERLATLEQRRLVLEMEAATAVAPAPRLHPNLAEVYRRKMAELTEALRQEDSGEARELVRSLVDYITLIPDWDRQRIEVRGELAAILRMAQGPGHERSVNDNADALAVQGTQPS
jgi:hypothetical protein